MLLFTRYEINVRNNNNSCLSMNKGAKTSCESCIIYKYKMLLRSVCSAYIERRRGCSTAIAQLVLHLFLDGDAEQGAQVHQSPLDLLPARLKVYVFHFTACPIHLSLISPVAPTCSLASLSHFHSSARGHWHVHIANWALRLRDAAV